MAGTWVITGTLSQPRPWFEEIIRRHGGKTSGSVSAKTTWLLAGEDAGSKLTKARDLNVRILSETEFMNMVPEAGPGTPPVQGSLF